MLVALWSFGLMGQRGLRSDRSLALKASFQLADFFGFASVPLVGGRIHGYELWVMVSDLHGW